MVAYYTYKSLKQRYRIQEIYFCLPLRAKPLIKTVRQSST